MRKVLLINPPTPFLSFPNTAPHLGLGYLTAYLRNNHIDVTYLNLENANPATVVIPEGFDFYGVTAVTPQYYYAKLIQSQIVKRGLGKTIIGGFHASLLPNECLHDGFDYVVRGYGEIALLNIVLGKYKPGIVQGESIRDLDNLPFPAWDDLFESKYDVSFGNNVAHMFTMRGCPFRCYYCCSPLVFKTKALSRSIENIICEIEFLKENFNIDSLYFFDATFTLHRSSVIKLVERLRELDLDWTCQTRVDRVDKKLLEKMKRSGCSQISFGIETGTSAVIDNLGKETTIEQNILAVQMAHDAGLKVKTFLMGCLPDDNWDTSKRFQEFLLQIKPDDWLYSTFIPFPGTPYWTDPAKFGITIHCHDFRTYYPLGLNAKGPVNISNQYLSRDELVNLRDDMLNFLRREFPNPRVEEAISRFPRQKELIKPYFSDLDLRYIF